MIEGLKVTVKGKELKRLTEDRANHHAERFLVYQTQIANFRAANVEGTPNMTNGDPVAALQARLATHQAEAEEMRFIAQHIDLAEDYLLDRGDLHRLGIVAKLY